MKKQTLRLVIEKGTFVADYNELHYFKQGGAWYIHGRQFSKNNHTLYTVACPDLYMELEKVKIPWEETETAKNLEAWEKVVKENSFKAGLNN